MMYTAKTGVYDWVVRLDSLFDAVYDLVPLRYIISTDPPGVRV